jgi:hypothetical protein
MEEKKQKQGHGVCELTKLITRNPSAMKIIQELFLICKISEKIIHMLHH